MREECSSCHISLQNCLGYPCHVKPCPTQGMSRFRICKETGHRLCARCGINLGEGPLKHCPGCNLLLRKRKKPRPEVKQTKKKVKKKPPVTIADNPLLKANNDRVTAQFLQARAQTLARSGYSKPKWIMFCEVLLKENFTLILYEARRTCSKYITVSREGDARQYKVRFSNHKPIPEKEARGDCDFFVGITNYQIRTTEQALVAVKNFFKIS